ncbi:GlxA family transcriptional regulator [Ruegeria sp.]|uniref:GlxA family transcriptional regulator n=1 Tax=Ruegeria sp. TaxID=1879320 RepID=UPI003C7E05F5
MENGAFILAKAGLLGSAEATPHIESRDSFAEEFAPELLSKDLHILTNHRLGCTGIVSEFDLFFALIRQTQGGKLADSLADIVSYGSPETKFLSRPLHRDQLLFRSDRRIARCIELMLANQEQPLSLADIGKRAGISVWQMRRLFLRELGRTPSTYYSELRLQRAREMLEHGRASLREIALSCGFADASAFGTAFKREYGITPRQCRAQV